MIFKTKGRAKCGMLFNNSIPVLFGLVFCNKNTCHKDLETGIFHFNSIYPVFLSLFQTVLLCSMLFLELALFSLLLTAVICKITLHLRFGMVNTFLFYVFIK